MGRYITEADFMIATGTDADEGLEMQIAAAEGLVDGYLGRIIGKGARVDTIAPMESVSAIKLKAYPVCSIASITDDAGELTPYRLDPTGGIVYLPRKSQGNIQVEYVGGVDEVPEAVRYAVILVTQALRNATEHDGQPLMSERLDGYQVMYYNQDTESGTLMTLSRAAAALLDPFRG